MGDQINRITCQINRSQRQCCSVQFPSDEKRKRKTRNKPRVCQYLPSKANLHAHVLFFQLLFFAATPSDLLIGNLTREMPLIELLTAQIIFLQNNNEPVNLFSYSQNDAFGSSKKASYTGNAPFFISFPIFNFSAMPSSNKPTMRTVLSTRLLVIIDDQLFLASLDPPVPPYLQRIRLACGLMVATFSRLIRNSMETGRS